MLVMKRTPKMYTLTMKLRVREKEKNLKIIIYIFLTLYNWLKLIEMKHYTKYDQLDILALGLIIVGI